MSKIRMIGVTAIVVVAAGGGYYVVGQRAGTSPTTLSPDSDPASWTAPGGAISMVDLPPEEAGKGSGVVGDDYPWGSIPQDSRFDPWHEYVRECTSFVAWALHSRNGYDMPFFNHAKYWGPMAEARGIAVDATPAPGAVAWSDAGSFGHVAWVAVVSEGAVTLEEYNYAGDGRYSTRTVPASSYRYIHFKDLPVAAPPPPATEVPPTSALTVTNDPGSNPGGQGSPVSVQGGSSGGQTPASPPMQGSSPDIQAPPGSPQGPTGGEGDGPTTPSAPPHEPVLPNPPATPAPVPVWPEQQGHHGANTFSNPHNASGPGPRVDAGSWAPVLCKVRAPEIQSSNPDGYWYRLGGQWSGQFYAVANTFMNGDPWDGPYTHNTDFAVADC